MKTKHFDYKAFYTNLIDVYLNLHHEDTRHTAIILKQNLTFLLLQRNLSFCKSNHFIYVPPVHVL